MKGLSAFNRLLFILNIFPAALLCVASYNAFYPLPGLSMVDTLGLMVPTLVVINFAFLLYWCFVKKVHLLISLLSLLIGFWCFGSIYQFNSEMGGDPKGISVLSYNVQGYKSQEGMKVVRLISKQIIAFIEEQDPDIICFQEFSRYRMRELTKYPHLYMTPNFEGRAPQAIFSKYPIIGKGSLEFPNTGNNALYVDIRYQKDTLRVYNVHLQSYQIASLRSYLKKNGGTEFLKRLQATTYKHREQAEIVLEHQAKSPFPTILCGDFNQTPYSPTFQRLQHGMHDTFKEKGRGWGTTFERKIISARIDFILAEAKRFEVIEHRNYDLQLSDHLPVMARVRLLSD